MWAMPAPWELAFPRAWSSVMYLLVCTLPDASAGTCVDVLGVFRFSFVDLAWVVAFGLGMVCHWFDSVYAS